MFCHGMFCPTFVLANAGNAYVCLMIIPNRCPKRITVRPQLFKMAGTAGIISKLPLLSKIENWWFSDLFGCIYFTSLYDQILQL